MSGDLVNCWRPEKATLSRIQHGFRVGTWKMRIIQHTSLHLRSIQNRNRF